jgi:ferrous iron transport protein A
MTLDLLPNNVRGKVAIIRLSSSGLGWLRAVGIFEGERVEVLRRAAFGGPLHLRTGSGGEFALDRTLAASIDVEVDR